MSSNDAALDAFNHAVSDWSNQFAPELRRVAYVIGSRMGWDHNEFKISWKSLQRHYEKAHGETISPNTLKKHARTWAGASGLTIISARRKSVAARPRGYADKNGQQRGGARQHGHDSTAFRVDFGVVVKSRSIYTGEQGRPVTEYYTEPWRFGQTAPINDASQVEYGGSTISDPSMTPHSPLNDPSMTPYSSWDSSESSSATFSSSGRAIARDDDVIGSPSGDQLQAETQGPDAALSGPQYGVAVCRLMNEHLDDRLVPRMLPATARDLLQRLWPRPEDIPAAEIGYGHMEDTWFYSDGSRCSSEAAVLANALKSADEDTVRFWVGRGAQRLAEMEAAERAEREQQEAETQAAAERERVTDGIKAFRARFDAIDRAFSYDMHVGAWRREHVADETILDRLPRLLERETQKAAQEAAEQALRDTHAALMDAYAARFFDGNRRAARADMQDAGIRRDAGQLEHMRSRLAATSAPAACSTR